MAFPAAAAAATAYNTMSDEQLRQKISQLSSYANPPARGGYVHTWATSTPAASRQTAAASSSTRATRSTRTPRTTTNLTAAVTPTPSTVYQPTPVYQPPPAPIAPPNPPRPPIPTASQALQSTYSSRLRTGATLLVQPIIASTSTTTGGTTRASGRRGAVINYADPGSGDELPDAGAIDSDDSDFVASGGVRTTVRQSGRRGGSSTPHPPGVPPNQQKAELDQSYLGMVPPARFIKPRAMMPTQHVYPTQDMMEKHALKRSNLIPIRVEFETETLRIRDCFVWNLNEELVKPETFARTFCSDLDLPHTPWVDTIANQIRAQIEEHEGVASMDLGIDGAMDVDALPSHVDETPECRVILSIDVQIANHHLTDHIEWDLLSPLTPEAFSTTLCRELGLGGEAIPLVSHAIHEELIKHKKDAIEWGVIDSSGNTPKDKTGLGLGWGRGGREGRGPKRLMSVWRDWVESAEFRTTFEVLSAEEVERREIERERASRRLRRETSKFQTTRSTRRIRY
ncbi:hypothetical protein H0H93_009800 [Arthromyces matolae]|nr:hypothetical protein H0H93_009800 [Arthromyces matolae]